MKSFPSSSYSNSLSSSYSLASTSLSNRLETIFKKASELSILCEIEISVIYYGPDGELKTWPEEREKVKDMAFRYSQLHETVRCKKRVDLYGFLNKKKNKEAKHFNKKKRKTSLKKVKYPISDHYSPDKISHMIRSLELRLSTLQERLRFVESQKQKKTKLDHQASLNHQDHQHQTRTLNPSQFSLFMYNNRDATFSQIPLSASNYPQDFSGLLQESGLKNLLMKQQLCGYDQNMCMSNINNSNFQHPALVNTQQDFSGLLQEPVSNYELNQLLQQELYGYDQNMCMSGITNNNVLDRCLSSTVSDVLCSDFQNPYGNMIGNSSSFSHDLSNMPSIYESSLLQTFNLPSLETIPNSYFISDNSRFL